MALDRILSRTRADVTRRKRDMPLSRFAGVVRHSDRSFAAALARGGTTYVMECKRASPSRGLLRDPYDPVAIARIYAPFADAISVLTDAPFFQGSHDDLRAVRESVNVPVLCKDFVVDPYQVYEARAYGADAVLLMLSVLDDGAWRDCRAAADEAGLDTLTEVHSGAELERALALDAPIIGINNRNLHSLQVDLGTTRELAPRVPTDRLVLCESGINGHADARALAPLVDGFLVGTSLMTAANLSRAVRGLVHGRTKVCGLTRPPDARAAWEAGATHGGLIFAPESPRTVTPDQARAVKAAAPLEWVGVFVNAEPARVGGIAAELGLGAVQLHGDEDGDYLRQVRGLLPPACEVWKAVRVAPGTRLRLVSEADRTLLDTWHPELRGGSGQRFDWSLLADVPERDRIILGGGLTPDTAAAADALDVWALDVNSGVEEAPGRKDHERMAAFLAARRGPGRRTG